MHSLTGLGASCASGVALAIAFPPVGAWPMAFLALVLSLVLLAASWAVSIRRHPVVG